MKNSKLRIIGGRFRGRKISFNTQDPGLRPSLDRVRETVFNWLAPYILDSNCLDLFAGSGIFGFEALSRGAKFVCSVENNPITYLKIIDNKNILKCLDQQLQIFNQDVLSFLQNLKNNNSIYPKFNIAFLDPPYLNRDLLLATLRILVNSNFMTQHSKIYFECDQEPCIFEAQNFPKELQLVKSSKAGRIGFYLLENINNLIN